MIRPYTEPQTDADDESAPVFFYSEISYSKICKKVLVLPNEF